VKATANAIDYQVANGIVTLTGAADVVHPQYHITGEVLVYDMNLQHFQGSGGDNNGRIRIQLEPEVVPDIKSNKENPPAKESPDKTAEENAEDRPEAASAQG